MEKELTKKEINKTIGETTKALNDKDKSVLVLTENMTVCKGNLIVILGIIAKLLNKLQNDDLIGKLAVEALINALNKHKKKEKTPEEMTTDEMLDQMKETMESIKELLG